ncbi:unnamed protein product [marine sediment metagenome]|uniref:Uncharacterized protein n=1 Tax=marine sediment metagenome TaxID=412755 RepID=X1SWD2_9ZZZZ
MPNNIYWQAKKLLDKKDSGDELTEKEQGLVNRAEAFTINLLPKLEPEYDNLPVLENLEEMAKIVDKVAAPRGGCWLPGRFHKPVYVGSIPTPARPEASQRKRVTQ